MRSPLPRIALTMGDPAGVGPEVLARALADPRIRAPARFVVKGEEKVGMYGEGAKAATVSLLRRYPHAIVIAASGFRIVWIHVSDRAVGATGMYPLVYDYFRTESPVAGNQRSSASGISHASRTSAWRA